MPNFNTHWLVAIKCRDATITEIRRGYLAYTKAARELRADLIKEFDKIANPHTSRDKRKKIFKALKKTNLDDLLLTFQCKLEKEKHYYDVTCFSAYMLGACGPDFWTLLGPGFSTAGIHFDMGHYNRTHQQFKTAIKRWKEKNPGAFQQKVEMSYFMGMATHIATDLVLHQLVNVYAGAYNLLKDKWENEHGNRTLTGLFKRWNAHNKVEHFWDSYIRYRYIGDYGYIWKGHDEKHQLLGEPLWFATVENLIEHVRRMKSFDLKDDLIDWLKKDSVKWKIEKPFVFPRVVCDRILDNHGVGTFIYDVVVDKTSGAYPSKDVFKKAVKEAKHKQMKDGRGRSEKNKLAYFSSDRNKSDPSDSFNYLNYIVCPNLKRLKEYGLHVFYHLDALKPFAESAMVVGKRFLDGFGKAIDKKDPLNIGALDHFWNLDTGLGLRIANIPSHTGKEVITQLNFIHVTDFIKDAVIAYGGYTADLHCMTGGKGKGKDKSESYKQTPSQYREAFKMYTQDKPGKDLATYEEEEHPDEMRYVDQIKLKNPVTYKTAVKLDRFFDPVRKKAAPALPAATKSAKEVNKIKVRHINHRLTLRLETAIPHIEKDPKQETLGFYVYGDDTMKPVQFKDHMAHKWLDDSDTKIQDYDYATKSHYRNLLRFKAYLLLNFENDKNIERKIMSGSWNNAVNYKTHKNHYSRNYAIATGRRHVLHYDGDGQFWADKDFVYYKNLSPTEHIFFSLYLLVRTPEGVFDMLTKEKVQKDQLEKIRKIDCLGFVKIVLFYTLDQISDQRAAAMLDECYVDGLRVPVSIG